MLIGIIGKANVGKSTFFKALTLANVLIANYPFATIEPNRGMAFVKVNCVCNEFNKQCNPRTGYCTGDKRYVPVEIIDVAGLVPGAHEGKGKGNQFLDDLRQADAFLHVVDISGSANEKGEPCNPGSYDPAKDIEFLEIELDMWILGILKKGWDRLVRQLQQEHENTIRAITKQLSGLNVTETIVKDAIKKIGMNAEKPSEWTGEQLKKLAQIIRKETKPMLIVANKIDIQGAKENYERCKKMFPEYTIIPASAESELALKEAAQHNLIEYHSGENTFKIIGELTDKQKNALEYIQKNVLDIWQGTGAQEATNSAVFDLLKYIAVFPGSANKLGDSKGNILPDCFLLPGGSTALDFANHIHTDLGKNFIAAIDVRTKRKIGRETQLKNRDVIEVLVSK